MNGEKNKRARNSEQVVSLGPSPVSHPKDEPTTENDYATLQSNYGNAAIAKTLIQRKPEEGNSSHTAETATTPRVEEATTPAAEQIRALIVDDTTETVTPAQMKKTEFLERLRAAVTSSAAEALAGTPWSLADCPYFEQWFAYYGAQGSQHIERAICKYAPEAAAVTSANGLIPIVTGRVRRSMTTWVTTGEVTGVPEALPAGNAAAGAAEEIGTAIGVGNLLFKERDGSANEAGDPATIQTQLGAGHPLDGGVRSRMEAAYGESFSDVQIHADTSAAGLSHNLNARAFTVGRHIAFGPGEYQPGTLIGEALIAHELAHVMQQRGGSPSDAPAHKGVSEHGGLEEDADDAAVGAVASVWGGKKRGLTRIARKALPALKSGLKLQRCPENKDPHAEYEKRLQQGVDLLRGVRFGLATEGPTHYDTDYWTVEPDPEFERKLTLKSGKLPSDAIDAMFDNLDQWSVDCAQMVQVAEWYALRHAYGAEKFNQRVGRPFELRIHGSTGINYRELYGRENKRSRMKRLTDLKVEPRSVEQILADAPIGSRVTWTNPKQPHSSPFYNENTVKLGPDLFGALGFGAGRNKFTRAEVELELAKKENQAADAAYVAANIFISQIGYYYTP